MLRSRLSKILLTDFTGLQDRLPGNHILLSHGYSVSRGTLITLENISVPGEWTLTINKDTYASLCQQATSWSQVGFSYGYDIAGSIATDSDGIYASNYGSGSGWHGPMFYTTLPSEIGKSGQYWHITFKVKATFASGTLAYTYTRVGFSTFIEYRDPFSSDSDGVNIESSLNNSSSEQPDGGYNPHPTAGSTNTYTFKFYHYLNNTFKIYINGTLRKNLSDPFVLDKGNNIAACQITQHTTYATPYFRVQEITVSTDPSYDPLP